MRIPLLIILPLFILLQVGMQSATAQTLQKTDTISAFAAAELVGQEVIIKGPVITVFFAKSSTGSPTFLNLEKPFPNNPVAIIIFENKREELGINAQDYKGKTVVVKGLVRRYKDEEKPYEYKPSITIYSKDQLTIVNE